MVDLYDDPEDLYLDGTPADVQAYLAELAESRPARARRTHETLHDQARSARSVPQDDHLVRGHAVDVPPNPYL